jgi:predicted metal-dependent HD superfamily phosphohydrolase
MKLTILEEAKSFVAAFFWNNNLDKVCYHNIEHTFEVVKFTEIIGRACSLDDNQLENALISALFHDIGYYKGTKFHERESAKVAERFLRSGGWEKARINKIKSCVLATKIPQDPKNIVEEVVCDADLAHLACEQYFEKAESLRKELESRDGIQLEEEKWLLKNREFFENHHFFTKYGRDVLQPGKQKNYETILTLIKKCGE